MRNMALAKTSVSSWLEARETNPIKIKNADVLLLASWEILPLWLVVVCCGFKKEFLLFKKTNAS